MPQPDGPFAYFTRYREGGQHPLIGRQNRGTVARETILLDGDKEAEGHAFFDLGGAEHSLDHRLLAWSADTEGLGILHHPRARPRNRRGSRRRGRPHLRRHRLARRIPPASTMSNSTTTIVPCACGAIGSARTAQTDAVIYEEPDPGFFVKIHGDAIRRLPRRSRRAITRRPKSASSTGRERTRRRASSTGARRSSSTTSSIRATTSSSSPTPTAPRTSRS